MSVITFNTEIDIEPRKIVVPHPPEFAAKTLSAIHANLSDIAQSASTAIDDSGVDDKRWRSFNAAQVIDSSADELKGHMEHVEGYINDVEQYARFWRTLALKYIRESRQNIRVVYVPFDHI